MHASVGNAALSRPGGVFTERSSTRSRLRTSLRWTQSSKLIHLFQGAFTPEQLGPENPGANKLSSEPMVSMEIRVVAHEQSFIHEISEHTSSSLEDPTLILRRKTRFASLSPALVGLIWDLLHPR